jgi:hypothetical protein
MKFAGRAVTAVALAMLVAGCGSRTTPVAVGNSSVVPVTSAPDALASGVPLSLASPAIPANDSEKARQIEATKLAHDLVAGVALPAGALRVSSPPAPDLTAAPQWQETQRKATAYSLFTLPSSNDSAAVFAFVQEHLAAGFTNSGGGSGDGPQDVVFEGVPTDAFEAPELMVSTEQAGNLMGVRVDAQVVWLPVRTAAEKLPATGVSATLQGSFPPSSAPGIALGPAESSRLAGILNALPTRSDATHHCPAVTWMAALTFATTPSTVVSVDACGVGVTVGGVDQPALADDGTLTNAVEQLLGLPVNGSAN